MPVVKKNPLLEWLEKTHVQRVPMQENLFVSNGGVFTREELEKAQNRFVEIYFPKLKK